MIRLILGGQLRGNESTWYSLLQMFSTHNQHIAIYVGSYTAWDAFSLPHKFTTISHINNSIFDSAQHDHKERYISQWSALYHTYHTFQHEFADTDIIVKARNDLHVTDKVIKHIEPNIIYTPEKEFHENKPFDINRVCNDQILIGTKTSMETYFNLPYKFIWDIRADAGIEEILRSYLYQQNIPLVTFPLTYTRVK